jgi:pyruvate/2-oxoglutarate dehydrogenase complex dihydrolipoamide acyltransferase (E2) component
MTEAPSRRRGWAAALLVASGIAALAMFWRVQSSSDTEQPGSEPARAVAPPLAAPQPQRAPEPMPAPAPVAAPDPDVTEPAAYDPTRHAHPITAEHLRMYREDELLNGAWRALRKRDFARARELVTTHQSEYPASKAHMDEGLLLLADCMEHPSAESRAKAQAFYDTKTFSPMRRRLRRLCLEAAK